MPQFIAPICNDQLIDVNGDPLVGGQIETYLAGSTTPAQTYTDDSGSVTQANPIILNSLGYTPNPIWLTGGVSYKFVIKNAAGVIQRTVDDIAGVNDASVSQTEWVDSGLVPTYINATSFSVAGDQTAVLQVGRRVRTTNTSGLVYSTIANSVFADGITTVTLTNDSTTLDAGLSGVAYALLAASPLSVPNLPGSKITGLITASGLTMNTARLLGRTTAGVGAVEELTGAQFKPLTAPPRGHISGLALSTAGSSATFSVAAGEAANSTTAVFLTLAESISKTTAAWAVGSGNGGLDTGAIANNTWYHAHLIRRPDTGVVDVLVSLSPTAPTLPANYTQFRRLGSMRTNGSAQWTAFIQDGDFFQWLSPVLDVDTTDATTAAVTRTLSVPTGVNVRALFNFHAFDTTNANKVFSYFSDLATTDVAPTEGAASPLAQSISLAQNTPGGAGTLAIRTNTSAQIRTRTTGSASTAVLRISTLGWFDTRGKDL